MGLGLGIYPNFTGVSSENRVFTKLAPEAITIPSPSNNAHVHTYPHASTNVFTHMPF